MKSFMETSIIGKPSGRVSENRSNFSIADEMDFPGGSSLQKKTCGKIKSYFKEIPSTLSKADTLGTEIIVRLREVFVLERCSS